VTFKLHDTPLISVPRLLFLALKERKEEKGADKAKKNKKKGKIQPCILEAHLIPFEALTW